MKKGNKKREVKKRAAVLVLSLTFIIILIGAIGFASAVTQIPSASLCCGDCLPQPHCGDSICNNGETCSTCPSDCGVCPPPQPRCGDGICNGAETCSTCAQDCGQCPPPQPVCGDGICNGAETCSTCSCDCGTCQPPQSVCGNGIKEAGEECDDGNLDNGDGCSSTCQSEEHKTCAKDISIDKSYSSSFGTGIAIAYSNGTWISTLSPNLLQGIYKVRYYVDNNVANTTNNAHITVKLDGGVIADYIYLISQFHSKTLTINTSGMDCNCLHKISVKVDSEQNIMCTADDASDNYVERNFFLNCAPRCGDGHIDSGEECDDGNLDDGDGCSSNCIIEHSPQCGDGSINQASEECDKGSVLNGQACTPLYGSSCTYCNSQCKNITLTDGYCNDGIINGNEMCDKGLLNGQVCTPLYGGSCTYCSSTCTNVTLTGGYCNDGIKQANEDCDNGALNGQVCSPLYGSSCTYCSSQCKSITLKGGYCGNGIKEANEQCDDGNTVNTDGCRNNCVLPRCGDGIKDKNEFCDDGNNINGDGCSATCRFECPNGVCTPNVTIEKFPPQVWQCDHRVVYDDGIQPGRISEDGQTLVERINNYAFEGEQIQWKVLVMDKNGIENIKDVYSTVNGNIESNCLLDHIITAEETIEPDCNARIGEENLTHVDGDVAAYYTCTLTVETSDSMYGKSDITVEAMDMDNEIGDMAEGESWFLNPTISLGVDGAVKFDNLRPGTQNYAGSVILTNDAEQGSGVILDTFVSGTNFYDSSHSGAKCGTTNQLSLKQFSYYASNGAYSTSQDMQVGRTCDAEGYCHINYGIGFNDPNPFYNRNEILQAQKVGPYYTANLLSPGASMALTFRVDVPDPCNGNFDSGHIYFWGEAV